MLEHMGRKSGMLRRTVLEVVAEHPDAVYVAAGWGARAHWLQNIEADPRVTVYLGASRFRTRAEPTTAGTALSVMREYGAKHPKALNRLATFMLDDPGSDAAQRVGRLAEAVPFVRLGKGL